MTKYRVMQETETGEAFNVYEGLYDECEDWLDRHGDQYVESSFFIEMIETFGAYYD